MRDNFKFEITYKINGKKSVGTALENEHYKIAYKCADEGLAMSINAKCAIELVETSVIYDYDYKGDTKVFVNGYQSWTVSREYRRTDVQKGLMGMGKRWPMNMYTKLYGDYTFVKYPNKPGLFHSFTYGYIKDDDGMFFLGSLTERQGYTIIYYDMINNLLSVSKDVEGVTLEAGSEYSLYEMVYFKGSEGVVFDRYFDAMNIKSPKMDFMCGYTSWYNYFGKISEKQLLRDLDGMSEKIGAKADIFQIDDGYQAAVGDWLVVKKDKFPNGMKYLADKIHSNGYKAGIWLAPFFAQRDSSVRKNHPDWLVAKNGRHLPGVFNWGGETYIIDFYIKEAADYIRSFFDCILNDWGYDMVKLDFLYAICLHPRYNKSRGQIMCEAMDFLRECCGDKLILGCGVPLAPSFGKVDFCRISCDVELSFANKFYVNQTNQEIVSAKNAINNSIFRRHLDGRAFGNDPDVFFLRENDLSGKDEFFVPKGKLVYTDNQKELLAKINNMFGKVLFVSDNIGAFDESQLKILQSAFTKCEYVVVDAEYVTEDVIAIKYLDGKDMYKLEFNTVSGENKTVKL